MIQIVEPDYEVKIGVKDGKVVSVGFMEAMMFMKGDYSIEAGNKTLKDALSFWKRGQKSLRKERKK